jgi:hypothetical protein
LQKGINQIETVTLDYKAIHQFSILYLQRRQKRSGKLERSEILLNSKGMIFAKMNQSIQNTNWNSNSWLQSNTLNFNPIAAKITKKSPENWNDHGRTHALRDGKRHDIIRPVFRQAYQNHPTMTKFELDVHDPMLYPYIKLEFNVCNHSRDYERKPIYECKTNTLPNLMHRMRISTTQVSIVMLRSKKLKIQKQNVKNERDVGWKSKRVPWNWAKSVKDRVMPEEDNPSFWDDFTKFTFFLTVQFIFVF